MSRILERLLAELHQTSVSLHEFRYAATFGTPEEAAPYVQAAADAKARIRRLRHAIRDLRIRERALRQSQRRTTGSS